ncbi:MAG: HAD family hydrolase [Candidatus Promineifilaceae bacterium]|jgi:epoxide hydrolase-like predicted phosphatase
MTIKAVIFDFGEVLNAPVDPAKTALRNKRLAAKLDLPVERLWSYLFDGEASSLWMTGQLDWDGFWQAVLTPRGIKDPEEIRAFAEMVFLDEDILNPEMMDLLLELKGRVKLAVLSNATRTEEEMFERLVDDFKLPEDLFDAIVTSASFGVTKPDPAIYIEAARRLGLLPDEAVFTDDMADFTAAASALGMHTHTFTTPSSFRQFLRNEGVLQ